MDALAGSGWRADFRGYHHNAACRSSGRVDCSVTIPFHAALSCYNRSAGSYFPKQGFRAGEFASLFGSSFSPRQMKIATTAMYRFYGG
jgi:hypothetical protein